ncbi:hypothetical protein ACS0TY_004053 [Phlomoides rotata]
MELIKIAEEKHSPQRRELRFWRSGRNQKAVTTSNILEAISQFSGGEMAEDGKVKIMVKKEDLKQVLESIRDGRSFGRRNSAAAVPFEQRLNVMWRRQLLRAAAGRSRGSWRPALHSIPEEL